MAADRRGTLGKGGLIVLAGAALLAACSSTPAADETAPRTVEKAQLTPPVGSRMPIAQTADLCKAGEMQYLVGKPRTEIPVPVDVVNRRVTCTACAITCAVECRRMSWPSLLSIATLSTSSPSASS